MLRLSFRVVGKSCLVLLLVSLAANSALAQLETATVSGLVVDPSGLSVAGAQVRLVDIDRDTTTSTATNPSGLYTFPSVRPGRYRMEVTAAGFKVVNVTGMTVNVQDHLEQNFKLAVGSVSESVTVEGGAPLVDTESAAVSTVVDRNFAENLPMNGRSFQTLIQLTPGVVLTTSNGNDGGQFSVNGQRAASNYWMVDGVSGNIGVSSLGVPGNGLGGALGSFSVLGGTNSLVSVDALQEFRIQTSTYAPEFGRTPGAQISILTRSGTNQFHGILFDYFRNDALDASDWFNGYTNSPPLPKAQERQNDFGGTFDGPIFKDRTFFFFSYEGLRLRLPQTTLTTVPDLGARQSAIPAMQPFLNAFPLDPQQPDLGNGIAQFNASYSNPGALDAYSLRVDHKLSDKLTLFGRYDYSPSTLVQRGGGGAEALSSIDHAINTTQTATVAVTWAFSPTIANDLRLNYSRVSASTNFSLDSFGGAVPLATPPFPSPFTNANSEFGLTIDSLGPSSGGNLVQGKLEGIVQRQINLVDNFSVQKGAHSLKFGADFRRLSPVYDPQAYQQSPTFLDVPSAEAGNLAIAEIESHRGGTLLFRNLGLFGEDTWRVLPRLTVTYGLRWDVDFTPSALNGPSLAAVTGFNLNDLSSLALAPAGTPPFKTTYGNFAPRIGVAFQLSQHPGRETVLRGGFGVFYDLATQEVGNLIPSSFPFFALNVALGPPYGGTSTFPLSSADAAPPAIVPSSVDPPFGQLGAFDPHLRLPYTLQWNLAVEQGLGKEQTISISYIGAAGRRLLGSAAVSGPNPNLGLVTLVTNGGTSDYDALQTQFHRRLSHGLQALASYTWSHSIDDGSAGSIGVFSNTLVPGLNLNQNRGPSDFDIRNALSAGVTYDIPITKTNASLNAILHGWSVENVIQARSAPPVNVYSYLFGFDEFHSALTFVRPDLVPGIPLYLYGPQYPGGKTINNSNPSPAGSGCIGPFCPPPMDANGNPLRQGDLGRNALRGFGAAQWDFAVHREFPIHELLKLQFRAEMFNVLNHPNFGSPISDLSQPNFGLSNLTLAQSLNSSNGGGGAFNPLYQLGGPRSIQLALKLQF